MCEQIKCQACGSADIDWFNPFDDWHDCPETNQREHEAHDLIKCNECGACSWVIRYSCGCATIYEPLDPTWDECPE